MRYKGHAYSDLLRSQQATHNEQQTDHVHNAEKRLGLIHISFFKMCISDLEVIILRGKFAIRSKFAKMNKYCNRIG